MPHVTVYVPLSRVGLGTETGCVYDAERRIDRPVPAKSVTLFGVVPHVPAQLLAECPAGYRVALPGAVEATVARVHFPATAEPLSA